MRIGAAYIRVSTDEQLEYSPDSQLKKIREYASINGITLAQEHLFIEEEGKSGRSAAARPAFQRMIGLAKTIPHPFEVILLWKFSRFARNREDSVVYKSMLRKQCGIDVVSVSEQLGDDRMSMLVEAFIEAMDEWYSINLSEEVLRGMAEKAARGGVVSAPAFGYLVEDGRFRPDPARAELVRYLFEQFVHAQLGCQQLATRLNALGVRTRKGGCFESRTVRYILQNPVYIGKIRWSSGKKQPNQPLPQIFADGEHPPLISAALFESAQRRLHSLAAAALPPPRGGGDFTLRGLVRCSACGSVLVHSGKGLQCSAYARGGCSVSHYISVDCLFAQLLAFLEPLFSDAYLCVTPQPAAPAPTLSNADPLRQSLQRLQRCMRAYECGIDSLEEYKQNKVRLLAEIETLRAAKAAQGVTKKTAAPIEGRRTVMELLRDATVSARYQNALLRACIDRIVFDRPRTTLFVYFATMPHDSHR